MQGKRRDGECAGVSQVYLLATCVCSVSTSLYDTDLRPIKLYSSSCILVAGGKRTKNMGLRHFFHLHITPIRIQDQSNIHFLLVLPNRNPTNYQSHKAYRGLELTREPGPTKMVLCA